MDRRDLLKASPMMALAGVIGGPKALRLDPAIGGLLPLVGSALYAQPWGATGVAANGRSNWVNVSKNLFIRVQIWSALGFVGDVTIDERSIPAAPAFPVATLANPVTTIGEYWSIPVTMYLSINVSNWVSGTLFAVIETHV